MVYIQLRIIFKLEVINVQALWWVLGRLDSASNVTSYLDCIYLREMTVMYSLIELMGPRETYSIAVYGTISPNWTPISGAGVKKLIIIMWGAAIYFLRHHFSNYKSFTAAVKTKFHQWNIYNFYGGRFCQSMASHRLQPQKHCLSNFSLFPHNFMHHSNLLSGRDLQQNSSCSSWSMYRKPDLQNCLNNYDTDTGRRGDWVVGMLCSHWCHGFCSWFIFSGSN